MAARRTDASYIVEAVARRNREIKATIPRDPSPSLLPLFLPFSSKQSPPDLIFSIKTPPLHEISTKRNETKFSKLLPNFFRLSIVKTQTSPPTDEISADKIATTRGVRAIKQSYSTNSTVRRRQAQTVPRATNRNSQVSPPIPMFLSLSLSLEKLPRSNEI